MIFILGYPFFWKHPPSGYEYLLVCSSLENDPVPFKDKQLMTVVQRVFPSFWVFSFLSLTVLYFGKGGFPKCLFFRGFKYFEMMAIHVFLCDAYTDAPPRSNRRTTRCWMAWGMAWFFRTLQLWMNSWLNTFGPVRLISTHGQCNIRSCKKSRWVLVLVMLGSSNMEIETSTVVWQ